MSATRQQPVRVDAPLTPLAKKLLARIRQSGPISVADYMAACLGDPEHGYYRTREPFGRGGDFVTAPEISQMFGELLGLWAATVWEAMGSPAPFVLAELGPGRGTLMADFLRAGRVRPGFLAAARPHLVETSPRLRAIQRDALAASGLAVAWHDEIGTLPAGPMILVANELFDALPARQFVRADAGWAERMVGIDAGGALAFGLRPVANAPDGHVGAPVGTVAEFSAPAVTLLTAIAERLAREGGAALVVDYGHAGPAGGDTLQALHRRAFDDPLAHPGEADITMHVDFAALAAAAAAAGAAAHGPAGQGNFLRALGLEARAAVLSAGKDAATREAIAAAVRRLAGPDGMGVLFKAMAVATPGLPVPGFDSTPATRDPARR